MVNSQRPVRKQKHGRGRNDNVNSYQTGSQPAKRRRTNHSTRSQAASAGPSPDDSTNTTPHHRRSKKERATNPSTRIHSLKRLLARDILPPEEKREKERELAGLLHDQAKTRAKLTKKQVLQRYHMVRFFERKKADRKLKQLRGKKNELLNPPRPKGKRSNGDDGDDCMALSDEHKEQDQEDKKRKLEELEEQIRIAEVDLNYTLYAPLGEKYIGIFAQELRGKGKEEKDEECGVTMVSETGQKPPMWYEIEKCMRALDSSGNYVYETRARVVKQRLEALRDRLPVEPLEMARRSLATITGTTDTTTTTTTTATGDTAVTDQATTDPNNLPAWLKEDGHIDPKDLDTDSDGSDDAMGDGGFFEH